jgi:hypothetical protein
MSTVFDWIDALSSAVSVALVIAALCLAAGLWVLDARVWRSEES